MCVEGQTSQAQSQFKMSILHSLFFFVLDIFFPKDASFSHMKVTTQFIKKKKKKKTKPSVDHFSHMKTKSRRMPL